jgi:hypothetical protein
VNRILLELADTDLRAPQILQDRNWPADLLRGFANRPNRSLVLRSVSMGEVQPDHIHPGL